MKKTVYFDLDGVLADFVRGAFRLHGRSVPMKDVRWDFPQQIGFSGTWVPEFWGPLGEEFWANLEPLQDGFALLKFVEERAGPSRIGIVSSPCETRGCCDGKRAWVKRYLPGYKERLFLGSAKEILAAPDKILVDDHDPHIGRFVAAGGWGVLVPRPWNDGAGRTDADGSFDLASVLEVFDAIGLGAKG